MLKINSNTALDFNGTKNSLYFTKYLDLVIGKHFTNRNDYQTPKTVSCKYGTINIPPCSKVFTGNGILIHIWRRHKIFQSYGSKCHITDRCYMAEIVYSLTIYSQSIKHIYRWWLRNLLCDYCLWAERDCCSPRQIVTLQSHPNDHPIHWQSSTEELFLFRIYTTF